MRAMRSNPLPSPAALRQWAAPHIAEATTRVTTTIDGVLGRTSPVLVAEPAPEPAASTPRGRHVAETVVPELETREALIGIGAILVAIPVIGSLLWWLTDPIAEQYAPAPSFILLLLGGLAVMASIGISAAVQVLAERFVEDHSGDEWERLGAIVAGPVVNLMLAMLGVAFMFMSTGPGETYAADTLSAWLLQAFTVGQLIAMGYDVIPLFTGSGTKLLLLAAGKTSPTPVVSAAAAVALATGLGLFLLITPVIADNGTWPSTGGYLFLAAVGAGITLTRHYRPEWLTKLPLPTFKTGA